VFLLIGLLIRLESRGPALFRQERVGRFFRPFTIYKFRTMVENAHDLGPDLPLANDPRVTRFGRFLRGTKLDELPSLINVLRGEMSLVGPRPEVKKYVEACREDFEEILRVRPGMTDVGSLVYRDEDALLARSETPEETYRHVILPEKLRLAVQYTRDASLFGDLKLFATSLVYWIYPTRFLDRVFRALSRHHVTVAALVQAVLVVSANALAFVLRFDGQIPPHELQVFLRGLPVLFVARMAWALRFGLFRDIWRFTGLRDMQRIVAATTLGTLTFWGLGHVVPGIATYSRAVLVLDWVLCAWLLGGVRLARRAHESVRNSRLVRKKVVVVGSGRSVERLVREMVSSRVFDCWVVGVVGGDRSSTGLGIHGVPILGVEDDLERVVAETEPDELVVACDGSTEHREAMIERCRQLHRPFRVVPDLGAILSGQSLPGFFRPVEAEAVLFREPIQSDHAELDAWFPGKRILITGAGGSIGSEISRQVASLKPEKAILFEKHENSLYEIERVLRKDGFEGLIEAVIGDVTDVERVAEVMARTRPHAVFHAAAYKHVPMMENNPREAYKTNVFGTRMVARLAAQYGVQTFVLISTDKAVEPVSIMGTTKRIAELELQALQQPGRTRFITVRFGNVLDSSGSVIPLFREQIESGGPVTVTHPDMTRLFMTIPEAVQLVLHTAVLGQGGELFVLDMGRPVRILDMAQTLIRLYGMQPGKDIEIAFTGLRPGEKLYERLFNDHEEVLKTQHPRILMAVHGRSAAKMLEEKDALVLRVERAAGGRLPGREPDVLQALGF
jgi:FlaA1/EpsC-like NDP-sugar epimerase/lipopolysaccharide/colanic/teichoic acid biosynthesis glycosyltransferase